MHTSSETTRRKLRYGAVALVFLPIGQGLIQVLGPWLNNYTLASLLAAGLATIPNFFANRHFVWRATSDGDLRRQVLLFWTMVMLAVLLATGFTYLVEGAMAARPAPAHGLAVFFAQLLGFGVVWVGRFLILDRWLFKFDERPAEHAFMAFGEIRA
ncbi:GtrA family protein [Mycobacterium basiliense]|uniref:GtrA family protein n=1 Tax=Mycobacterium basiliense TaxID=2094119 RepID=UPI001E50D0CE|nr:GtrA family protein [Mycobacterium basiliense]